jgi:hypothetical protein
MTTTIGFRMRGFAVVLASLFAASCGRSPDAKLVGTWRTEIGGARATVSYSDDYTVRAEVEGQVAGMTEGTWRIEGDQLITKVRKSTLKPVNEGKEFREVIAELEDDQLIVMDSDRKVLTYWRVR